MGVGAFLKISLQRRVEQTMSKKPSINSHSFSGKGNVVTNIAVKDRILMKDLSSDPKKEYKLQKDCDLLEEVQVDTGQ